MDAIDKLAFLADLGKSFCELNHGPNTKQEDYKAVDYIVQAFGYNGKNQHELLIPICAECVQGLQDADWVLLYCFSCNQSQWINKKLSKNKYKHKIIWLNGCPSKGCTGKFGGIYFTE